MPERLEAVLELNISSFTSQLQQASASVQQFAQGIQQQFAQAATHVQRATQATQQHATATQHATAQMSRFGTVIQTALGVALGQLGVQSITAAVSTLRNLAESTVKAAVEMQSLTAAFTAIHRSAQGAQQALAFVRAEATRLGVDFVGSAQAFKGLEAAARGTSLEGAKAREIFTAVAEASRVMGLSGDQTKHVLIAIEQMMSKGKVSAEELRRQMGNFLPGAFEIAARSMGLTTAELDKMLRTGQLLSEDFLPRFARQLRQELGPGVEEATKTARASFDRLGNEVQALAVTAGNAVLQILQPIADFVSNTLRQIREVTTQTQQRGAGLLGGIPEGANPEELARFLDLAGKRGEFGTVGPGDRNFAVIQQFNAMAQQIRDQIRAREELTRLLRTGDLPGPGAGGTDELFASITQSVKRRREALEKQLTRGDLTETLVPSMREKDVLTRERGQLHEIDKAIKDIVGSISVSEGLEKQLTPELQKQVEWLNKQREIRVANITNIEGEITAQKKAEQEARKAATQRETLTKQLTRDLIKASDDTVGAAKTSFEEERQLLTLRVEESRKAQVDETLVTAFEAAKREDIDRREAEHAVKQYRERYTEALTAAEAHTHARKRIEEELTAIEAQETKSRVDDFLAAQEKKRAALFALGATDEELQRHLTATQTAALRIRTQELEEEAKKQQEPWIKLANTISSTLQGAFYQIFTGAKDIFGAIRDVFLRLLAQLAADALTNAVVIPVLVGLAGGAGGGAAVGTAGAAGGGGTAALGQAGSVLSIFGGGSSAGITSKILSNLGVTGLLETPVFGAGGITGIGAGTAPGFEGITGGTGAFSTGGLTVGGAAAGVGAGIGAGLLASNVFSGLGFTGRGANAASGAIGGAVAGTIILPGIGTAIGAAVGALIGGLIGGGSRRPPQITLGTGQAGIAGLDPFTNLLTQVTPFNVTLSGRSTGGLGQMRPSGRTGLSDLEGAVSEAAQGFFAQVLGTLGRAQPEIQAVLAAPLNTLAEQVRGAVAGRQFTGENVVEQVREFVQRDLPQLFADIFGPLQQAVARIDPIVQGFNQFLDGAHQALNTLAQARQQLNANIDAQIQGVQELVFTPAQFYEARRGQLAQVWHQFVGASPADRLRLAPQIQGLVADIARLAPQADVLGQEPAAVRALQEHLVDVLNTTKALTGEGFDTLTSEVQHQIDLATEQVTLLTASLSNLASIDTHLQEAIAVLRQLTSGPLPSFQHGTNYVARTGLAWLHQGERVTPASGHGGGATQIVIHVNGADDPQRVAETVMRHIERRSAFAETTIPTRSRNLLYTH